MVKISPEFSPFGKKTSESVASTLKIAAVAMTAVMADTTRRVSKQRGKPKINGCMVSLNLRTRSLSMGTLDSLAVFWSKGWQAFKGSKGVCRYKNTTFDLKKSIQDQCFRARPW
jgi:hypothetical protein